LAFELWNAVIADHEFAQGDAVTAIADALAAEREQGGGRIRSITTEGGVMTDIAEFLLARIAEDRLVATNQAIDWANDPHREHDEATDLERWFNPARIFAECEARRRIVKQLAETGWRGRQDILKVFALPYASHEDYRQEWKP
jgi:hypothetical protein